MIIFNILKKYSSKVQSVNKIMKDRIVFSTRDPRRRQLILHRNYIYTQKEPPWSILFFGTDDFALQSLRKLYDKYEARKLVCRLEVVTAYDGKENAVTRFAQQHEIPIHNWPPKISLTEFHIGLVVSFGHLIPAHMIRSFPLGMLNVHGSLLPRWRGAAPIIYTLMNGDTETGVSIMKVMPKKFDIGEVLAQRKIDVHPEETMPQLRDRMSRLGADLLLDTVEKLPTILESAHPQNEQGITYAPKVTSKLSLIKWDEMTAKNVYDLQRALYELYPLTTKFMDLTVKLLDVRVLKEPAPGKYPSNRIPGLVMFNKKLDKLVVCCRNNSWISVCKIGYPGRPPMAARDFNNGFIAKNKKKEAFFLS